MWALQACSWCHSLSKLDFALRNHRLFSHHWSFSWEFLFEVVDRHIKMRSCFGFPWFALLLADCFGWTWMVVWMCYGMAIQFPRPNSRSVWRVAFLKSFTKDWALLGTFSSAIISASWRTTSRDFITRSVDWEIFSLSRPRCPTTRSRIGKRRKEFWRVVWCSTARLLVLEVAAVENKHEEDPLFEEADTPWVSWRFFLLRRLSSFLCIDDVCCCQRASR